MRYSHWNFERNWNLKWGSVGRAIVSVVKLDLPGRWDYKEILSVLRWASAVLSKHGSASQRIKTNVDNLLSTNALLSNTYNFNISYLIC